MASARFAWGIDIGNRALKAVKLVRDGDKLRVDDFELIEHESVLSSAGDNRDSLIQTALANFVQKHPMKGGVVAVGVAGQASFARFIKLPPVEPKKIPEIVKFEAIQQIPFPLDDVEWGYQLFQSPESPDVEVGIFAMRKELIGRHIKFFTDVDMNVQVVQMSPLAVYNAMYYDQRLKGTTMVIDLGAENTDLIICDNDTIWMRSIPIGGNSFTETLVKGFKLPFAKAEDLKRNAATSKYARQIFQAMRPVFADLVAEIQRSVGFYASVHRDSRIKRIIALGGTFRLPGLQKYLQQNLSLEVERLDNLAAGAPADPKLAAPFNENLLSVIGAYGLAVQAMGEGKITSSLLPSAIRREKLWKQKIPIFASTAALFCVGTGLAFGGYSLQKLKFDASSGEYRTKIDQVKNRASKFDGDWQSNVESQGGPEKAVIQNMQSLSQYHDTWTNILHDIQAAAPLGQPAVVQGFKEGKPELIKSIPRGDREQIFIRAIISTYSSNVNSVIDAPDPNFKTYIRDTAGGSSGPTMDAAPGASADQSGDAQQGGGGDIFALPTAPSTPGAAARRGYVITIKGSSPNKNAYTLIQRTFCENLLNIKPTDKNPKKEYQVVRAVLAKANFVREDGVRLGEIRNAFDQIRIEKARRQAIDSGTGTEAPVQKSLPQIMGPNGQPIEDPAPYMDRLVPGEDVRNDLDFSVVIVVILDPPAPAPATPTALAQ